MNKAAVWCTGVRAFWLIVALICATKLVLNVATPGDEPWEDLLFIVGTFGGLVSYFEATEKQIALRKSV